MIMYILALLVVLAVAFVGSGSNGFAAFIDIPSVLVSLVLSGALLGVSGLWKDFLRALKAVLSKENIYTSAELKKSILAVKLTQQLLIWSGFFGTLIGVVAMFHYMSDPTNVLPALGVSLLTLLYGTLFALFLHPMRFRLESHLVDEEEAS